MTVRSRSRILVAASMVCALAGIGAASAPATAQPRPTLRIAPPEETLTGNMLAAGAAWRDRDLDSAANFYSRALLADPNNPGLLIPAFFARLASGDVERAMPLATRILTIDKINAVAHIALGAKSIKDRAFASAKPNLTGAEANVLNRLWSGLLIGWATYGQGDADAALSVISGIAGPPTLDGLKAYNRALIADLAGRRAEAVKAAKEAYDANPRNMRVTEAYARLLARTNNAAAAQKLLLEFTETASTQPLITQLLRDISLGKTPGPQVATVQEGAAEVLYSLANGIDWDAQQETIAPLIYLQLAVYLNPKSDIARLELASRLQTLQNLEKSASIFQAIPEDSPLKPTAIIGVAFNRDAQKQTEEAIAMLKKLLEKSPNETNAAAALGDIYRSHKRFAEAAVAYSQAIATLKTPVRTNYRLFYNRAISYERSKDWPKAEADFKKALELYPDHPSVLNYLGYSWVDMGINLDLALGMIRKAVELQPDEGAYVDSLGWAYFRLGRYQDAVETLEKAVLLDPKDPTINDHLGDAYWHVGRTLEATFQWRHAKDFNPEPEDLVKIVRKLETGAPADAGDKKPG